MEKRISRGTYFLTTQKKVSCDSYCLRLTSNVENTQYLMDSYPVVIKLWDWTRLWIVKEKYIDDDDDVFMIYFSKQFVNYVISRFSFTFFVFYKHLLEV